RVPGFREAVTEALRMAEPGDVVLLVYEKLAPVLALLADLGAVPAGSVVPALPARAPRSAVAPARALMGNERVPVPGYHS
ncbi:MAG TPA: hypothetical protein VFG35_15290, partial [Actinoplanes sp.]|nr:hypothetical protein [Actinoplanes sp.]